MGDSIAPIITLLFTVLMLLCFIGLLRCLTRFYNSRAAWSHRKALAEIANKVESDPAAPEDLKYFVGYMADRAFDDGCLAFILRQYRKDAINGEVDDSPICFKEEFGDDYADLARDALENFSLIVLYSNTIQGFMLRENIRREKMNLKQKSNDHYIHDFVWNKTHREVHA
jgi:hypothetical protein